MTVNGLEDNTLLRLAQYAEVPIPACPAQGGFQLSFRLSASGTVSWTTVSVGRIGKCDMSLHKSGWSLVSLKLKLVT